MLFHSVCKEFCALFNKVLTVALENDGMICPIAVGWVFRNFVTKPGKVEKPSFTPNLMKVGSIFYISKNLYLSIIDGA